MTLPLKTMAAVSLIAMTAACVPAGNNRVDSVGEIEATTDTALGGQNVPGPAGAPVRP